MAPDTVNEIFTALRELEFAIGTACEPSLSDADSLVRRGRAILLDSTFDLSNVEILLAGVENSKRKVVVKKAREAYLVYRKIVAYYAATQLAAYFEKHSYAEFEDTYVRARKLVVRATFENIGGQLMRQADVDEMLEDVRTGRLDTWQAIHQRYHERSTVYPTHKFEHALASLLEIRGISMAQMTWPDIQELLDESVATKEWICREIWRTRNKDYENPYRMLVYANRKEMDTVVGAIEDNPFIQEQEAEYERYRDSVMARSAV